MTGRTRAFVFASLVSFCFSSCSESPIPRPKGYQRINIPEASFSQVDLDCGLSLEKPQYSSVELIKSEKSGDACWFNLKFDRFNARLHCTQVEVHDNLYDLMEDAQDMVFSHDIKANGISRIRISEDEHGTNGVLYHLGGPVATPLQFFVTDSSDYFVRGSLYFNHKPNADSTAPVVRRLLSDVEHVMRSISWEQRGL